MKKNLLTLALCAFTFIIGLGINNFAVGDVSKSQKIGYVNTTKLLAASKTLKSAQDKRTQSTKEMLKWYDTANADIQKQTTKEAKNAAIKKYEAQLTQKKKSIKDEYAKKLNEIEKQLTDAISQKATSMGYDIILKDEVVLFGGDDITAQVLPLVK